MASIAFTGTFTQEIGKDVISWSRDKLTSMSDDGDEPDEELLTYISVMIGNKKNMQDIKSELDEFIGEDKAR